MRMVTGNILRDRRVVRFVWALLVGTGASSEGVSAQISAEYRVEVRNPGSGTFHVSATFSNLPDTALEVALPVWTPGVYDVKNYASNVTRFTAQNAAGARLRAPKVAPSAWRIETGGSDKVTIEFNYSANDPSWNGAGVMPEFAIFTGTQLFLEPIGHRSMPSTVRFVLPAGWRVASALRPTADSMVYAAANYDELVDAPAVMGSLDVIGFEAEGTPFSLVIAPAGAECGEDVPATLRALPRVIAVERAIFGSLPYGRYTIFCVPSLSGGALEHGSSYLTNWLDIVNAGHELFHAWNVKRIRPAEMWPYDYSRVDPGPSLWVAEGLTSYYEAIVPYRANLDRGGDFPAEGPGAERPFPGMPAQEVLLRSLAYRISQVESDPERRHVSPSDASISDGLGFGAVRPSYYTTGQLIGLMLDLSIVHDTRGERRLDDVMRTLFRDFYEKDRGFTPDDLVRTVSANAGRDYSDFFQRYVTGTEDFPFDSTLAHAGYRITREPRTLGVLPTVTSARSSDVGRVVTRGRVRPPADGGVAIMQDDVITAIDGVPIFDVALAGLYGKNWIGGRLLGKAGERVTVTVIRSGKKLEIPVTLGTARETVVRILPDPAASPEALAVRAAWLRR